MELLALLEAAGTAPRERRIEWGDRIAAHGVRAIESVRPWLADPALAAFAIRVIERAGSNGEAALATRVLRSARPRMAPILRGDVDWALQQLRVRTQVVTASVPAATIAPTRYPLRQERPTSPRMLGGERPGRPKPT